MVFTYIMINFKVFKEVFIKGKPYKCFKFQKIVEKYNFRVSDRNKKVTKELKEIVNNYKR